MNAVDALVEVTTLGQAWHSTGDPEIAGLERPLGPWSVSHAVEIARAVWRRWQTSNHLGIYQHAAVRVIDSAGVVVEQWPKTKS